MTTRIGIELSPIDCRIVEIDAAPGGPDAPETRVRSVFVAPSGSREARARLARLRGREAAVVAWGLRGDHRQAVVNAGRWDSMRREAAFALRAAGIDTRGALTDIAPAGPRFESGARRPVVMALASRADVASALRPLRAAGIRVKSVVTPGAALGSIARLRRGRGADSGIEAYVALEENATCIALVRAHVLAGARELPWGYVHEHEPFGERVPREKIAARLARELIDFFSTAGVEPGSVSVVCICGTLPELRSMCMLLMEKLDLEVEPLDSMFGVEAGALPQDGDFRERGVEMRLAWAAAADWKAPLNLLREPRRRAIATFFTRAAVIAGVGAGVTLGWAMRGAPWLEASGPAPWRTVPSAEAAVSLVGTLPASAFATTPIEGAPIERAPIEQARSEPARSEPESPPAMPVVPRLAQPIMHEPAVNEIAGAIDAPEPVAAVPDPEAAQVRRKPDTAEVLHLGSILFGPDRQLAMIDGQIVEAGDDVRGAMVVEISPTTVTLKDSSGRVRRLSLAARRQ